MIHHVFACKSNIGDWLSALGIQALLATSDVEEHLCDEPYRERTLDRLSRLSASDVILIGGGGLLMDYFDSFWAAMAPIARCTPTVIWGVGLCDNVGRDSRPNQEAVTTVFSAARFAVVRDELTLSFLKGHAEGPVACPTLSFLSSDGVETPGLLYVHHTGLISDTQYAAVASVVRAFATSTNRPFSEVRNRLKNGNRAELDRLLAAYRHCDVVVSSRLHGCIIGTALGKKVVAIAGDRKVESFMSAAGLESWVWRDGAVESLARLVASVTEQPDVRNFVASAVELNRLVAKRVHAVAAEAALV